MPAAASDPDHRARTRAAYDANAERWTSDKFAQDTDLAETLVELAATPAPVLDLGCGPGWHLPVLGTSAVGLDLSRSMLDQSAARLGGTHGLVQGDLSWLPFARGSFGGAWASRTLVHLPRAEVPFALSEIHRVLQPDGVLGAVLFPGDSEAQIWPDDSYGDRTFSYWDPDHLRSVIQSAGFAIERFEPIERPGGWSGIKVLARRIHTLPDFVGAGMRLLVCGLNPSPSSADSGVGFFKAGNRFWPAALGAGLVDVDRDPRRALHDHGIGMTDLVKRPTRRADELASDEYTQGLARLDQLAAWLKPEAICMVGLAGWRAAINRKAVRGWQDELVGGRPVYVMPSTSGLNAHDTIASLTTHLRNATTP